MPETAMVFEDRRIAGNWRVEWFDDDGGYCVEIFTVPEAWEKARQYAKERYGTFREVRLHPYGY
jgi:hypothetical protein